MSVHVTNVKIKSEWTDYNKHLNMAYYVLVFDQAWEILLEKFDMGESSAKTTGMSTMVLKQIQLMTMKLEKVKRLK